MRDEASLQRLVEMGFAVYVPRGAAGAMHAVPALSAATHDTGAGERARVVLLARADTAAARALLEGVRRALAFAHIDGSVESAVDSRTADAAGLVVFGEALAREAGAAVPAPQQKALQWVSATDAAAIASNPQAKRALWSELRRIARALRGGAQT